MLKDWEPELRTGFVIQAKMGDSISGEVLTPKEGPSFKALDEIFLTKNDALIEMSKMIEVHREIWEESKMSPLKWVADYYKTSCRWTIYRPEDIHFSEEDLSVDFSVIETPILAYVEASAKWNDPPPATWYFTKIEEAEDFFKDLLAGFHKKKVLMYDEIYYGVQTLGIDFIWNCHAQVKIDNKAFNILREALVGDSKDWTIEELVEKVHTLHDMVGEDE